MPAAIWMLRKWHCNLLVYYEKINSLCFQSFNWLRSHGRGLPRQPPSLSDNFIKRSHVKAVSLQAKFDPIWFFRALQMWKYPTFFELPSVAWSQWIFLTYFSLPRYKFLLLTFNESISWHLPCWELSRLSETKCLYALPAKVR